MGLEDLILPIGATVATAAALGFSMWGLYARFYLPVPPNRALVLFGHRSRAPRGEAARRATPTDIEVRPPRIVVGGGVFVAPWNKGVGHLSLEPVVVDLTVRSMHAFDAGRASGWETRLRVQVKIPADPAVLATAAQNLLEKSEEDLGAIVRRTVEGAVPAVLARLRPASGEPDWDNLAAEIQAAVAPDLIALGLVVRSLTLTELRRIAPSDAGLPPSVAALPAGTPAPAPAALPPPAGDLEARLSRAERHLGIIGAEVARLGNEPEVATESPPPISVFDYPLGYEVPGAAFVSGDGDEPDHDSMGGERSPRTGRLPRGSAGPGTGREPRPLSDTER